MLRVLPADLLVQRRLFAHLHDALRAWVHSSVGEAHLRELLLQLLLVHLVFGACVVFVVLDVLNVLDVRVQVVDLDFEVDVNRGTGFVRRNVFEVVLGVLVGLLAVVALAAFVL